jgi:hypothetical protein
VTPDRASARPQSHDPPAFELYTLDRELTRDEVISELAQMPGRFRKVLSRQDTATLERRSADGWSAIETCRHIRDVVQVYGVRFKWMILNDAPFLPNYEEDRWVAQSPDTAADLEAMLREIEAYRGETVRLLSSLADEGWSRSGWHETLGDVVLEPYVRHQLAHELQHLEQLKAALA